VNDMQDAHERVEHVRKLYAQGVRLLDTECIFRIEDIVSGVRKGFLDYRRGSGPNSVELFDIAVEERRTGRGRSLVDTLIKHCASAGIKRIYAIARAENRIAGEFYEALNFRAVPLYDFYGVRTENGDRTVDAVMYVRDLEQYP